MIADLFYHLLGDALQTADAIDWVGKLGPTGLLALFGWLWYTGKIVTRRELDASEKRCTEWKDIAQSAIADASRQITVQEKVANTLSKGTNQP